MIPFPRPRSLSTLTVAALFSGLPLSVAYSQIVTTDLLIDLDAANYNQATGTWTQSGVTGLPGSFTATGSVTTARVNGFTGVLLDGGFEHLQGPQTTGSSLEAATPTYSVEVWAYQGNVRDEETMVGWSHRGTDNSNMGFNWGVDQAWGASGHWGNGPDQGWTPGFSIDAVSVFANNNTVSNVPTAGSWHLMTYTYDGTTERVYSDGVLRNSEAKTLTPFADNEIVLGTQNEAQNLPHTGRSDLGGNNGFNNAGTDLTFSGVLGRIRIHSGVLTDQQVADAYNTEKAIFQPAGGPPTAALTLGPTHRYSFTGTGNTAAPTGTVVVDSVGGQDGTVLGNGAIFTIDGKKISLPGGASNSAAYIDLPNGLISSLQNVSLEAWVQQNGDTNWSRIVDFGVGDAGEIFDVGGAASGTNYIMLSGNAGTNPGQRLEHVGGVSPNPGGGTSRDSQNSRILNREIHIVLTYDSANAEWRWYQDGALMEAVPDISGLASIPDVNNWLGRSQWTGDANLNGFYDEFRIYDYALTQEQVLGNFAAGPDVLNVIPEPGSGALLALGAAALSARRRRVGS
ncbi:MAG TPA: LamG-like jellyroll fold domain-containing protein [Chthoniobacteraceae bacterium]|nr:LamG-like jellyroll fold domain-containing protein [Chthoniobacteraceae bacterium]